MSTKSYYLYIKQFSHDGTNWINVQPLTYSYDGDGTMTPVVKEEHDAACGAMPPIYQWVDTEDTICVYEGHDYSREYLTIESLEDNNVIYWKTSNSANTKTISASTDNGATWTAYTSTESGTTIATLNTDDKVLLKGINSTYSDGSDYNAISSSKQYNVYGNIMSLINGDNFVNTYTLTSTYTFSKLFYECTNVVSAENLQLPATTLASRCYYAMFWNCTSLTTAPQLPATTLTTACYEGMFYYCTSLTATPQLPATTLATDCYHYMFAYCYNLITVPVELPATSLNQRCYANMFLNCRSITTAPVLPATTLAINCYSNMFDQCSGLTVAPDLPATTLRQACYSNMFDHCTNLGYIKCLATDISANLCTHNWVRGVAANGTFVKNAQMSNWTTDDSGIPNNWTIQNA